MAKKFKSDAFASIHSSANALLSVGGIDKATMRKFDEMCIVEVPEIKAEQIRKIRLRSHVSQPIFARYLNTSPSTVKQWEAGDKRPSGMALKLLAIVEKHGIEILA